MVCGRDGSYKQTYLESSFGVTDDITVVAFCTVEEERREEGRGRREEEGGERRV